MTPLHVRITQPDQPVATEGPYPRARAERAARDARTLLSHTPGAVVELLRDGELVQGWRRDGSRWRPWPRTDGGEATTHTARLALRCTPEERAGLERAGLTGRRAVDVLLREAAR